MTPAELEAIRERAALRIDCHRDPLDGERADEDRTALLAYVDALEERLAATLDDRDRVVRTDARLLAHQQALVARLRRMYREAAARYANLRAENERLKADQEQGAKDCQELRDHADREIVQSERLRRVVVDLEWRTRKALASETKTLAPEVVARLHEAAKEAQRRQQGAGDLATLRTENAILREQLAAKPPRFCEQCGDATGDDHAVLRLLEKLRKERAELARKDAEIERLKALSKALAEDLAGIVHNHDEHGHVDASWFDSARAQLAALGEEVTP